MDSFVSVITMMSYFMVCAKNMFHVNGTYSLLHLSLKAVLLHNGNKKPSISIEHSVHMKECYDHMQVFIEALKYSEYH